MMIKNKNLLKTILCFFIVSLNATIASGMFQAGRVYDQYQQAVYAQAINLVIERNHALLVDAIIQRNLATVKVFSAVPHLLDRYYITGQTALHIAIILKNAPIALALITAGSNCNLTDGNRQTPMHCAVFPEMNEVDRARIIQALMARGALCIVPDCKGRMPHHIAARFGRTDCLKILFSKPIVRKNINKPDNFGRTPLHLASQWGHLEAVKLLLSRQASHIARDYRGQTALHLAALGGHSSVVLVLLKNGAQRDVQDLMQRTPLLLAALNAHAEVIKVLIHGISPIPGIDEVVNAARRKGHGNIVAMLEEAIKYRSQNIQTGVSRLVPPMRLLRHAVTPAVASAAKAHETLSAQGEIAARASAAARNRVDVDYYRQILANAPHVIASGMSRVGLMT